VTRTVAEVVEVGHILVCCGSGGVGKTTSAAVLAMEGARRGRRAVVVTIDPAKRLASALGLDELSNEPREIATARWDPKGERIPGGALSAMMLDTKSTFDGLVTRYAASDDQKTRILENSFYRNISSALSGTQEYMAMEKLHELEEEGGFDLIVVDTPPSRHALDFLDAPQRLLRLLDNRIFRLLMVPTRTGLRIAGAAVQAFVRTISRVVGSEVVNDIVAFFRAFEGMEEGFRERAKKVVTLLGEPTTRFVLITSPQRDAVEEARFFAEKIGDHNLAVDALIVNRVHPRFGTEHASGLRARAASLRDLRVSGKEAAAARARLAAQYANLADFNEIAEREESHLETVRVRVGSAAVAFVPYLAHDVYDFDALAAVGRILFNAPGDADPLEASELLEPGAASGDD
jgi:anion-transporting  ArsA/GET3 family ATPase